MSGSNLTTTRSMFTARLDVLEHLIETAAAHFKQDPAFLQRRIAADMLPLGTQIAFTCNHPRNFALWCEGRPADNLDPEIVDIAHALRCIGETRRQVSSAQPDDGRLAETIRIDLTPTMYAEMPGPVYIDDFLIPNFYFHLVTVYDILRMAGLDIGKKDYMLQIGPYIRQR